MRKQEPVIAEGQIEFLCQDVPELFAYRRFLGTQDLFVVNNLTGHEVALGDVPWAGCEKVLGNYEDGSTVLRPYEAAIYRARK